MQEHTHTHKQTDRHIHAPTRLSHAPSVSLQDDEVTEEDFIEWLLACPTFTSFTQWLLGEECNQLKLTDTDSTPSYHQTIAKLTRGTVGTSYIHWCCVVLCLLVERDDNNDNDNDDDDDDNDK